MKVKMNASETRNEGSPWLRLKNWSYSLIRKCIKFLFNIQPISSERHWLVIDEGKLEELLDPNELIDPNEKKPPRKIYVRNKPPKRIRIVYRFLVGFLSICAFSIAALAGIDRLMNLPQDFSAWGFNNEIALPAIACFLLLATAVFLIAWSDSFWQR
jgi:hypothetical protein